MEKLQLIKRCYINNRRFGELVGEAKRRDMVALEAKYHKSCLTTLSNDNKVKSGESR